LDIQKPVVITIQMIGKSRWSIFSNVVGC